MNRYRGWEPNIYAGGFKWPVENEWAGEIFNFQSVDGRCYGHVEVLGMGAITSPIEEVRATIMQECRRKTET